MKIQLISNTEQNFRKNFSAKDMQNLKKLGYDFEELIRLNEKIDDNLSCGEIKNLRKFLLLESH